MDILVVANPEAFGSIYVYSARCTDDMVADVSQAFKQLGIAVDSRDVDGIAIDLSKGKNYWLWHDSESYCFDLIHV